jgi:hypothetical protein
LLVRGPHYTHVYSLHAVYCQTLLASQLDFVTQFTRSLYTFVWSLSRIQTAPPRSIEGAIGPDVLLQRAAMLQRAAWLCPPFRSQAQAR